MGSSLDIPIKNGRLNLQKIIGDISLEIHNTQIQESKGTIAKMTLDIPTIQLGEVGGQIKFKRNRATFSRFKLGDQDIDGQVTGYVELKRKWNQSRANTHIGLRLSSAFTQKTKEVRSIAMLFPRFFKKQSG